MVFIENKDRWLATERFAFGVFAFAQYCASQYSDDSWLKITYCVPEYSFKREKANLLLAKQYKAVRETVSSTKEESCVVSTHSVLYNWLKVLNWIPLWLDVRPSCTRFDLVLIYSIFGIIYYVMYLYSIISVIYSFKNVFLTRLLWSVC